MKTQLKMLAALTAAAIMLLVSCARTGEGKATDSGDSGAKTTETVTREGFVAEKVEKPIDRSGNKMRLGAYLWYGFVNTSGLTNRHPNPPRRR